MTPRLGRSTASNNEELCSRLRREYFGALTTLDAVVERGMKAFQRYSSPLAGCCCMLLAMRPLAAWWLSLVVAGCASTTAPSPQNPTSVATASDQMGRKVVMDLPSDTGALVSIGGGGEPLVLDFWAPSCKPCVQKVPALVAREAELRAKGVRLILVAVLAMEESTDAARATLASWGVSHPFLIDREEVSRRAAGVVALPSTLVLDRTHVVRWSAEPTSTIDDVIAAVRQ